LVFIGWSYMIMVNSSNAMVQSHVPDELRGRVMSVYTLVFFGSMPLGSLLAGAVADKLTEPVTVMISAGVLLMFAVFAWVFMPGIRKQE
jgi:MFS family permease